MALGQSTHDSDYGNDSYNRSSSSGDHEPTSVSAGSSDHPSWMGDFLGSLFNTSNNLQRSSSGYSPTYGRWSAVEQKAAAASGDVVDSSYFDKLIGIESRGKQYASSGVAAGLFQFTKSTAALFGLSPSDRYNPDLSATAAGKLTRANASYLSKHGIDITQGNLYVAHQQGAKGAVGLLSNPDSLAKDIVGRKAISQNLPASSGYHADTVTAKEFTDYWGGKFSGGSNDKNTLGAGGIGGSAVAGGNTPNTDSGGFWSTIRGGAPPGETDESGGTGIPSVTGGNIGDTISPTQSSGSFWDSFFGGGAGSSTAMPSSGAGSQQTGGWFGALVNGTTAIAHDPSAIFSGTGAELFNAINAAGQPDAVASTGIWDWLGSTIGAGTPFGPALGVLQDLTGTQTTSTGILAVVKEYFLRIIVIILGLIFVAVGLSLFKPATSIMVKTVGAMKK